ncbi:hypothetical protein HYW94_00355 [Candidatus Uhrbacteria bacterium]|nr:hypothetical protein [Candidatus Uhrbacteria bacterium]
MRKKSPENFSITDGQQERKQMPEKKKNSETEKQREQKERPTKIEGRISQYIKNLEEREDTVEKFLDAKKNAHHTVDVAQARNQVPDREHEKRKKKDYQSYEKEFEKRKTDSDAQIEQLKKEEQTLSRLYKEGPKDAREALAVKRNREGGALPAGVLGKLGDRLMLAFQGHAIQKEAQALLQKEKKDMRDTETPDTLLDIRDKIQNLQKEKEGISRSESYKDEVEKNRKEEKDFFLKHTEEQFPKLALFLKMDKDAISQKLQDPSLKDNDLFSLMEDIGDARAELTKRHQATDKALERTRYGYLLAQEGKDSPKADDAFGKKIGAVAEAIEETFKNRMFHSRSKALDNTDLRYLTDNDIKKIATAEANISKSDKQFAQEQKKIVEELIEDREKAHAEAERAQHEVVFHTSRQDNFLKILEDQLYSMRALRATHPEKASGAQSTSHDDKYIFFQPDVPASGYGAGGEKGSAICGFATVEGFLMKSALTTDTGANPGRPEVAVLGVDGAATVMEPSGFVAYMPESVWKKARPIIAEKYRDAAPPEIVVYQDALLQDRSEEGVSKATEEIARLVKERVQEIQKRGGYPVESGGIRTTPDGYQYYEEDSNAW